MPEPMPPTAKPVTPPSAKPAAVVVRPASIHGDSPTHKTHWGLIAGMLGVFLVLETVFLGYTYMKQSTKDTREVIVEPTPEQLAAEQVLAEQAQQAAALAQQPTGLFAHLVTNPEQRTITSGDTATFLRSQVKLEVGSDTACLQVGELGVADPAIVTWLSSQVSEKGLSRLAGFVSGYQGTLHKVCRGQTRAYAIVFDQSGLLATLAIYDADKEYWNAQQPVTVADDYILLYPDIFTDNDNQPLVVTGIGDAGTWAWKFWVPTASYSLQLVEDCSAADSAVADGAATAGGILTCKLEYVE